MTTAHTPGQREPVRLRLFTEPLLPQREIELPQGDVTEGVVRVGNTVRRPAQPQSFAVAAYLDHLADAGFTSSPRFLGRDAQDRDVLDFMPGTCAGSPPEVWAQSEELLISVAQLLRRLHDASANYRPDAEPFPAPLSAASGLSAALGTPLDAEPEIVCHLDVTPQNVVVAHGRAAGLVDFDLAGLAPRAKDAYNTAMHWVPLADPGDLWPGWESVDQLHRLRIFADAYGLTAEERRRLPEQAVTWTELTWTRMQYRAQHHGGGWARMWAEGVGDVIRRRHTWLTANAGAIREALCTDGPHGDS